MLVCVCVVCVLTCPPFVGEHCHLPGLPVGASPASLPSSPTLSRTPRFQFQPLPRSFYTGWHCHLPCSFSPVRPPVLEPPRYCRSPLSPHLVRLGFSFNPYPDPSIQVGTATYLSRSLHSGLPRWSLPGIVALLSSAVYHVSVSGCCVFRCAIFLSG